MSTQIHSATTESYNFVNIKVAPVQTEVVAVTKNYLSNRWLQVCEGAVNQYQESSDLDFMIFFGGDDKIFVCSEMKSHEAQYAALLPENLPKFWSLQRQYFEHLLMFCKNWIDSILGPFFNDSFTEESFLEML